jgi:hypothetical protein
MELKRLEVYQKEYRESSSATIEKGDAKYKEIYWTECTRSVESGQPIEFLKKSPMLCMLEARGEFAASVLAGIGDDREMRRAYFHLLCLAGKGRRCVRESDKQRDSHPGKSGKKPTRAETHGGHSKFSRRHILHVRSLKSMHTQSGSRHQTDDYTQRRQNGDIVNGRGAAGMLRQFSG